MHEVDAFLMNLNEKTHARGTCRILQPLIGIQTRANSKHSLLPPPFSHPVTCTECSVLFFYGVSLQVFSMYCTTSLGRHNFNHLMFFSLACLLMILMNFERHVFSWTNLFSSIFIMLHPGLYVPSSSHQVFLILFFT